MLHEHLAVIFGSLFIFPLEELKFALHLFFEVFQELLSHIAHSFLVEDYQGILLCQFVELLQFLIVHRHIILVVLVELALENLLRLLVSLVALVAANVGP